MDKLIYFFHRQPALSRGEFFDHYLFRHAPMGMRTLQILDAYTVNLTDTADPGPDGPDAVTEIWTESATDFMDTDKLFRSAEDAAEVIADNDALFSGFDLYWVSETVVRRGTADGPLGVRSSHAKRVSLFGPGERPPAVGPDVLDVIEQRVVQELMTRSQPVELIVTTTAPTTAGLGPATERSYDVSEYRQRVLPQAERANA